MTDPILPGQFRLSRLQLINWGTFDGYVNLPVPRRGFLVTGRSGSGKSTLIDAISSVLVPSDRVDFNAAAQQNMKRGQGRNLVSYIRGAWRRRENPETGAIESTYLRPKATYSVVALTYDNGVPAGETSMKSGDSKTAHESYTLTAFFYLRAGENSAPDVTRMYGIMPGERNLSDMHRYLSSGIDVKALKRDFPDATFSKRHRVVSVKFRKALGMASEEAQLLLHRTQSAKSLASLDQLFRDYMLPEPTTFGIADDAVAQFGELRQAYERVEDIRQQISVLEGLPKLRTALEESADTRQRSAAMSEALPQIRDRIRIAKLRDEVRSTDAALTEANSEVALSEETSARLNENLKAAEQRRDNKTGSEQAVLQAQLSHNHSELETKRANRDRLANAIAGIGGDMPTSASDFKRLTGVAMNIRDTWADENVALQNRYDDAVRELQAAKATLQSLTADIKSLGDNLHSNIPRHLLAVRDQLSKELGLGLQEIPFAGELIDVLPAEAPHWQPVIERQLSGLATTLLVPESMSRHVSSWVNGRHLGVRLRYRTIPETREFRPARVSNRSLVRKVSVVEDSPFHDWLEHELAAHHNYECVDSVDALNALGPKDKGVTASGLVRYSTGRDGTVLHDKDDRHRLGDRTRYVLGSTNHDKVSALQEELKTARTKAEHAGNVRDDIMQKQQYLSTQKNSADIISNITWDQLDSSAVEAQIAEREAQLAAIFDTPEIRALQEAVVSRKAEAEAAKAVRERLLKKVGTFEEKIRGQREELADLESKPVSEIPDDIEEELRSRFDSITRRLHSGNISQVAESLGVALRNEERKASIAHGKAAQAIVVILRTYAERWPSEAAELQPDTQYVGEAVVRLEFLRSNRLAEFRERFLALMNGSSVRNLGRLSQQLRRAQDDVEERIAPVNHSLRSSEFNEDRWLRIDVRDQRSEIVRAFQRELDAAVSGGLSADTDAEAERRFRLLSEILERLGSADTSDKRWRRTVLDTRRHVGFVGEEINGDDEVLNTYVDSAALSGGQAQKLVFFCLAAALRYQLADVDARYPTYGTVVLDEAFDRADPEYTRRAMDVFTRFGFHMVLATPMKLIQTLSPYVDGTVIVNYREEPTASGDIRARSGIAEIRGER